MQRASATNYLAVFKIHLVCILMFERIYLEALDKPLSDKTFCVHSKDIIHHISERLAFFLQIIINSLCKNNI
jgi:hypothetical protein